MNILLRKVNGVFGAMIGTRRSVMRPGGGGASLTMPLSGVSIGVLFACLMVAVALLALVASLGGAHAAGGFLLATAPVATTRDLKSIIARMTEITTEFKGKVMPQNIGEEYDKLAQEGKAIQDEAARDKELKALERFSREVPDPIIPGDRKVDEVKGEEKYRQDTEVAGYMSPGALFINSEAFAAYKRAGMPVMSGSASVDAVEFVRTRDRNGKSAIFVPLSRDQRKAVEHVLRETKAIPTLGTGVIEPQRVEATVTPRDGFPRIRDVLNVARTNSNSVQFMYRASHTNAAAVVAAAAAKPESASAYSLQTANVRTIAEWIPVTEQMLEDAPAVINAINTDLMADLDDAEEAEITYGAGTGEHFLGLFVDPAVVESSRFDVGDTLLDKIRRTITDVRRNRYRPNGMVIDPIDMEELTLLKGTAGHYIWAVVTDDNGSRIWGVRAVETPAAENATTGERNIAVGDFQRGASLWVRTESAIAMGWNADDFTKNKRTIRAERRAAFAVRAGDAIMKIETNAAA